GFDHFAGRVVHFPTTERTASAIRVTHAVDRRVTRACDHGEDLLKPRRYGCTDKAHSRQVAVHRARAIHLRPEIHQNHVPLANHAIAPRNWLVMRITAVWTDPDDGGAVGCHLVALEKLHDGGLHFRLANSLPGTGALRDQVKRHVEC